jgi:hypothetical protein
LSEDIPLSRYCLFIPMIRQHLDNITEAIEDPQLDCEQTIEKIACEVKEATGLIAEMQRALEGNDDG